MFFSSQISIAHRGEALFANMGPPGALPEILRKAPNFSCVSATSRGRARPRGAARARQVSGLSSRGASPSPVTEAEGLGR
jgi:hypothetical protein